MRRTTGTLLTLAISATVMAVLVLVSGTAMSPSIPAAASPSPPMPASFVDPGTCLHTPMATFAAPGAAGWARLCDDGQDVRITLQTIGLPPGEQHTAWLSYRVVPLSCRDTACRPTELDSGSPDGATQQIGRALAARDGTLELNSHLRDLRLVHGAEVTVQILGELGRTGPYLQARVVVP